MAGGGTWGEWCDARGGGVTVVVGSRHREGGDWGEIVTPLPMWQQARRGWGRHTTHAPLPPLPPPRAENTLRWCDETSAAWRASISSSERAASSWRSRSASARFTALSSSATRSCTDACDGYGRFGYGRSLHAARFGNTVIPFQGSGRGRRRGRRRRCKAWAGVGARRGRAAACDAIWLLHELASSPWRRSASC